MDNKFVSWLLGQADFALAEGNTDLHMFLVGLHAGLAERLEAEYDLDLFAQKKDNISHRMAKVGTVSSLEGLFVKGKYMGFVNIVDINNPQTLSQSEE